MIDLLPCPFCAGNASRQDIDYDTMGAEPEDENYGGSFIECNECGACTKLHFGCKENLVDSWNRRTEPLPKWRCCHCDNGIELEWEFCAWCGASEIWKTAELDIEECGNHSAGSPPR